MEYKYSMNQAFHWSISFVDNLLEFFIYSAGVWTQSQPAELEISVCVFDEKPPVHSCSYNNLRRIVQCNKHDNILVPEVLSHQWHYVMLCILSSTWRVD